MSAGSYPAACAKLGESVRLEASVGGLAKLAECEEHIQRLVASRGHWQQAEDLARARSDRRAARVSRELQRVDAMVPKLVLDAPADTSLVLEPEDLPITAAMLGTPFPVEPGDHTVVASAPGKRSWTGSLHAADGAVVRLSVPALLDAPPVAVPPPPAAQPPPDRRRADEAPPGAQLAARPGPPRWLAYAGWGGAAIAAGLGAWLGLEAEAKKNASDASGGCVGNACPAPQYALRDDARTYGDWSTGMFVAAGALAASGIVVFITARARITPTVGGVSVTGAW
jgi:hypothetical protein